MFIIILFYKVHNTISQIALIFAAEALNDFGGSTVTNGFDLLI